MAAIAAKKAVSKAASIGSNVISKFKSNMGKMNTGNPLNKMKTSGMTQPAVPVTEGMSVSEIRQNVVEGSKLTQAYRKTIFEKIVAFLKWLFEKIWEIIDKLIIRGPLMHVFKHLAKWIALLIVIIIVFVGVSEIGNSESRRSGAYSESKSTFSSFMSYIKSFFVKSRGILTPLGKKATNGIPRESEPKGRCNDVEWVSMEGNIDKKYVGFCLQSSIEKPSSVRWIIEPSNLYEYDTLPTAWKERIQLEQKDKLVITIPYIRQPNTSFYQLSCKDATYEDGTSAKDLFEEKEETEKYCKLKPQYVAAYKLKYRAPRSSNMYKGLDVYKSP